MLLPSTHGQLYRRYDHYTRVPTSDGPHHGCTSVAFHTAGCGSPQKSTQRSLAPSVVDDFATSRADEGGCDNSSNNKDATNAYAGRMKCAELKCSVFDTYALCAALLASFVTSGAHVNQEELMRHESYSFVALLLQQLLVRFCTIGAIYPMLVFMFCALYSKSALARERYGLEVYQMFLDKTNSYRTSAFWCLYYTVIMCLCQVMLTTFYTFPMYIALAAALACGVSLFIIVKQTREIVSIAGVLFFTDEKLEMMLQESRAQTERN